MRNAEPCSQEADTSGKVWGQKDKMLCGNKEKSEKCSCGPQEKEGEVREEVIQVPQSRGNPAAPPGTMVEQLTPLHPHWSRGKV